jgi:hypothetical protein
MWWLMANYLPGDGPSAAWYFVGDHVQVWPCQPYDSLDAAIEAADYRNKTTNYVGRYFVISDAELAQWRERGAIR